MDDPFNFSLSRRHFIQQSTAMSAFPLLGPFEFKSRGEKDWTKNLDILPVIEDGYVQPLNLAPAQWLWYPSQRCLPNTFVLFRRVIEVKKPLRSAAGWIIGESRYKLFVNGTRMQFGPAPADPRFAEADPIDLLEQLEVGENAIGAEVLYYGLGDGTWPIGKPGFLFKLELIYTDGTVEEVVSDINWRVHLCRAWPPGKHKRWYLRALQEDFDARFYPTGWTLPGYEPDHNWLNPMNLGGKPDQTALATSFRDYLLESSAEATTTQLRARSIPMLREERIPVKSMVNSFYINWIRPPEEYFELLPPDAYRVIDQPSAKVISEATWRVDLEIEEAAILTFDLSEQIVGFPYFSVDAPEGTIIELMVQEGHNPDLRIVMNNHFHSWTRFTCRGGPNYFECFDFESLKWLQLHIRNAAGRVEISEIGVRRRCYPWPESPSLQCNDPLIQSVWDAAINTLYNAGQETIVDGMGRERQQYSGDIGHALHAIFYSFGDKLLPARFVHTFSQGLTKDGYFLDCWPAYDRLARLSERQLDLTPWGPLIDHSIGFNFDCYHYYLYTADLEPLREVYPRLLVFAGYLEKMRRGDRLLPVEDIGVPWVWMDSDAYQLQRHKQCAFNLYASAAMINALAPLALAFKDQASADRAEQLGKDLLQASQKYFWDPDQAIFIANRPWRKEEGIDRLCDRSLSGALLWGQCPGGKTMPTLQTLITQPDTLGLSYPANAGWRMWALAKYGRMDLVQKEWRERWASMGSVQLNNTIQEGWNIQPDSNGQWSHCPVAPLYLAFMGIAGLHPLEPGFTKVLIRPQPAELEEIDLIAHTVRGPIHFATKGNAGNRRLSLRLPESMQGFLALPVGEEIDLKPVEMELDKSLAYYQLPAGKDIVLNLKL